MLNNTTVRHRIKQTLYLVYDLVCLYKLSFKRRKSWYRTMTSILEYRSGELLWRLSLRHLIISLCLINAMTCNSRWLSERRPFTVSIVDMRCTHLVELAEVALTSPKHPPNTRSPPIPRCRESSRSASFPTDRADQSLNNLISVMVLYFGSYAALNLLTKGSPGNLSGVPWC